jgi:hypothetical protein
MQPMATSLTISTGPLTSSRSFQDDAKAQAALLRFYTAYNLAEAYLPGVENPTNQQKLDAVLAWFIDQVVNVSVQSYIDQERVTVEQDGRNLYDFKGA